MLILSTDVAVQFQRTSYTLSSQSSNSVEICVKSTSKGTSEEFVIIVDTDATISEVLAISILTRKEKNV